MIWHTHTHTVIRHYNYLIKPGKLIQVSSSVTNKKQTIKTRSHPVQFVSHCIWNPKISASATFLVYNLRVLCDNESGKQ